MTEYATTPSALAECMASRARTHEWVYTSPPPINPHTGSSYFLPASRAPSGAADSDVDGEKKPHSEWDGDGWEPSDCESSHSVPPVMELQYPGGEKVKIGSSVAASPTYGGHGGHGGSMSLKDELDRNLPGAPVPMPVPPPPAPASGHRSGGSRSGSVKSHRTSRTTTTAAARAAPLPPSLPSSGSGSGSGGQRSPTRSQHSQQQQPSQHSRARTRSLPHSEQQHYIDVDFDNGGQQQHPLPPIPSQPASHHSNSQQGGSYPFNPIVPQPMSISPAHSRSTQPEQILIRPPASASQRSHSNASNNSMAPYSHVQSAQHHSPTSPHSPHSLHSPHSAAGGGGGGGFFPSSYSHGTVAAGVPLPAPSSMSASLSYATAENPISAAASSHHGQQQPTPYPMQHNELPPSLPTSAYGHGMASVTPSQSPSNQATPPARSRGMQMMMAADGAGAGSAQGTPRALSRAQTMHSSSNRAQSQSHRSLPQSPQVDDQGGGGGIRESYVFVEPPYLPAPAGSSRRSASGSQGQGQGHAHSHSYPPPSVHGGSQSTHTHSVHNPPTLAQRYEERGMTPPSVRSRSGGSRRESGHGGGGEGSVVGGRRSESRASGRHPPSIVYAPSNHSHGTHFNPPSIVRKPSAHASGGSVAGVGVPQVQMSPMSPTSHGSFAQAQMDAPIAASAPPAVTTQQQMQQHAASRQMSGTPVSSLRRAHTVSHHSTPASVSVSVRPPSQQSLRGSSRSRGVQNTPQPVIPSSASASASGPGLGPGAPGMATSASAPLPAMGQEHAGSIVIPRGVQGPGSGYPTPPASANGGGSSYGHGNASANVNANPAGSWGRASQTSKKSRKGPASNASVGSLLLGGGGRRSGSVSRDLPAPQTPTLADAPAAGRSTGRGGGFLSRFKGMGLGGGGAHAQAQAQAANAQAVNSEERERERGRGLERGNSRSGSGSRSSSRSSASTYYVLPTAGQKVKILRTDGVAVSAATSVHPNHTHAHARSASSGVSSGGWLKKALTPTRFFRSSSHQPPPNKPTSHRSRASIDVPMSRDMSATEKEQQQHQPLPHPDSGVAFTSGGVTVAPTAPSAGMHGSSASARTRTTSERSGRPAKLRKNSDAGTIASRATSAGNAGIGAGSRVVSGIVPS